MARQLVLIEPGHDQWKLDDATRTIGRRGIAAARAALAAPPATGAHQGNHRPAA